MLSAYANTMAGSSFGTLFRVTTFGESHCKGVGAIIDGCPPGMPLTEADVQPRAPDTEEYIVRERVPAADLEELAYSGALALPSAATALMGLRRLRRAGLL